MAADARIDGLTSADASSPADAGDAGADGRDAPDTRIAADARPDTRDAGPCVPACDQLLHVQPNSGATCVASQCVVPPSACLQGYGHCTANPSDGCETDLTTAAHCGSCTTPCVGSDTFCQRNALGLVCAHRCADPTPDYCGGHCTNVQTDLENCGGCNQSCSIGFANSQCSQGVCNVISCTSPEWADCTDAPGCETPLGTRENCTGCGDPACGAANTLFTCRNGGSCDAVVCAQGFANCDTRDPDCESELDAPSGSPCGPRYLGTWAFGAGVYNVYSAMSADGSTIIAGQFAETLDFDPSAGVDERTPQSGEAVFVSRLDAQGNYQGTAVFDFPADPTALAATPDGGVILVGQYNGGDVDLDPGPGVDLHPSPTAGSATFVVSLDRNGSLRWARTFAGSTGEAFPSSVAVDATGAVYLAGPYSGTVDFDPGPGVSSLAAQTQNGFVLKLTAGGDFAWVRSFYNGATCVASLQAVTVASDGNVWAAGAFNAYSACIYADPRASLSFDLFVVQLTPAGDTARAPWLIPDASGQQALVALAPGDNGSVYIGSTASGLVDFDPGPAVATRWAGAGSSGFVLKLDATGAFVWATVVYSIPVVALARTPDGGVIALGDSGNVGDASNGFVSGFSSDGVGLWTLNVGALADAHAVAAAGGGFVVAGHSRTQGDYDPGPGVDIIDTVGFASRFDGL
jgi:hypothetical protein